MNQLLGGLHIGPFTIYYSFLGGVLFVVFAAVAAKLYAKREGSAYGDVFVDTLLTSAMIWVIVWKVSGMAFVFQDILEKPVQVLFSAPAAGSGLIATGIAGLYLFVRLWRAHPALWLWVDILVVSMTAGLIPYFLLHLELGKQTTWPWGIWAAGARYQPVNFYEAGILAICLILALSSRVEERGVRGVYLLTLVGVGSLSVTYFTSSTTLVLLFSPVQWSALLLALLGIFGMKRFERTKV